VSQQFLILGILLMPLQVFSLFLAGSRFDLSPFVLLLFAGALVLRRGIRQRTLVILLSFFLLHVVLLVWFGVAPAYRLFSGIVWLGGVMYLVLDGDRVQYSQKAASGAMLVVLGFSAILIVVQSLVLGYDRASALFWEPSFAGLCLYSAAAGILLSIILVRSRPLVQLGLLALFLLLFGGAYLTLSMHFVTFVVTVSTVLLFLWAPRLLRFRLKDFGFRTIAIVAVFGAALTFVAMEMLTSDHFLARIDFANPKNFSLLSWLRGFDQMRGAIDLSPVFGVGLGSTGYFPFPSAYSVILERLGKSNLNLTDAYSLGFRLIIEIGLPLVLIFLGYLVVRLRAFVQWANQSDLPPRERIAIVFNFVWGLGVIAGCFLKEPLYSQSFLYVAAILIASVPLRVTQASTFPAVVATKSPRTAAGGRPPDLAPTSR
jgi:hypothetical protein